MDVFRKDIKMREVKVGSVEEFQGQVRDFRTSRMITLIM